MLYLILSVKCKQSGYRLAVIDFKMEGNYEGPDFLKNKKSLFSYLPIWYLQSFLEEKVMYFLFLVKKLIKTCFSFE